MNTRIRASATLAVRILALFLGTGAGLAAATGLSKDWDAPSLPVQPGPVAGPSTTGLGLTAGGTW